MSVVALLRLLCELLLLVREVLRMSVYELWMRYVVGQGDEAIATFVLSIVITTRKPAVTPFATAVVTTVRLVRLVVWLAVWVRVMGWREVGRWWMPAGHGRHSDQSQPLTTVIMLEAG